ncbi:MAG TPA: hypothetical protein VGH28_31655 [Polyangiaceae bacterium]
MAAIVDGAVALLVWAAKHAKATREVEYAARSARRKALAAMNHERLWSPGKAMLASAIGDGVDPADLEAVRAHAVRRGHAPDFVAEFLPPGPTWLGHRGWRWLEQP